ncbi:uncharacterized protein B0P05DRAFT_517310 [Gilbertella persicaria]|uniref:uncharacterized protein n=1 Tax=Gilbertella persicaria TaxID=101096 RepID=UPI00221EB233|nr:uncharacterized protein B0P05DRAFT_517310 [Gilbertella persicaria]KAI8058960.1 hypothetical protein B0P05DRAFT_517310 [Gilbertella persicaria]
MSQELLSDIDLEIPYYETPPSYKEFLSNHLMLNKPAIIGSALTQDWKARKEWIIPITEPVTSNTTPQPKYKPNYQYLKQRFGAAKGQVARCDRRHFTDQERMIMSFAEFADLWEAADGKPSVYYLKDLHLVKLFPKDIAYQVPEIFEDDWLNEYWLKQGEDDYRFTYLGGDSTFTPFHADVYRSYSWSSNICGIKKWTLFPPGQEDLFKDRFGNMIYDIRNVDTEEFPKFKQARCIEIYQRDGETIFVPSGWFHQVENIGAAISINHNWSNACNLMMTYQSIKNDLDDVKAAIQDIKESVSEMDFIVQCQHLLLAHSGWNWHTFLSILCSIVDHRSDGALKASQPDLIWQLDQIERVLEQWEKDEEEDLINYLRHQDDLHKKYTVLKSSIASIRSTHKLSIQQ